MATIIPKGLSSVEVPESKQRLRNSGKFTLEHPVMTRDGSMTTISELAQEKHINVEALHGQHFAVLKSTCHGEGSGQGWPISKEDFDMLSTYILNHARFGKSA